MTCIQVFVVVVRSIKPLGIWPLMKHNHNDDDLIPNYDAERNSTLGSELPNYFLEVPITYYHITYTYYHIQLQTVKCRMSIPHIL